MKKTRGLKERICALVLALLLPVVNLMPEMTLVVSAGEIDPQADTTAVYTFEVIEQIVENGTTKEVPIQGANVSVYNGNAADAEDVLVTDANGQCTKALIVDAYQYQVSKGGYDDSTRAVVPTDNIVPVAVTLGMKEIAIKAITDTTLKSNGDTQQFEIENPIDGAAYQWSSDNTAVVTIDDTGLATTVGAGTANITVAYHGNTSSPVELTVKNEITGMAIAAVPDNTDDVDVNQITLTASGLPNEGTVEFYKGDTKLGDSSVDAGTASYKYSDTSIMGKMTFKAVYLETSTYFKAEASTNELTYKKSCDLVLKNSSTQDITGKNINVIYGDSNYPITVDVDSKKDRTEISFSSNNENVATVTNDGTVTIVGAGDAVITANAAESDNYTATSVTCTIKVAKKTISVKIADFAWENTSKVYDANDDIQVTGKIVANATNGLVGADEIGIKVNAKTALADSNTYGKFTIQDTSAVPTGTANYNLTVDYNDGMEMSKANVIEITHRPVYVQVQSDYTFSKQYGTSTNLLKDIQNDLIDKGKSVVVLVGENGIHDPTQEEGLVATDTKDTIADAVAATNVKIAGTDAPVSTTEYGVSSDNKVIEAVVDSSKKLSGNYEIIAATDEDAYKGTIVITKQETTDDDIWSQTSISPVGDGGYSTDGSTIWVSNNKQLSLKLNSGSAYNTVNAKLGAETAGYGSILTFSNYPENAVTSVDSAYIYLSNTINGDTRTINTDTSVLDNMIPSGKIKVDRKNPTATFNTLKNPKAGLLSNFSTFQKNGLTETVAVADEGSGLKSVSYHILTVTKDDNIPEMIEAASTSTENGYWTEAQVVNGTVSVTTPSEESNYIILVKVSDNVDNTVVYSSNGLVIDSSQPTITLDFGKTAGKKITTNKDIPYTIKIDDVTNHNIFSGIAKVEVVVTKSGDTTPISGNYDNVKKEGSNSFTIDLLGENRLYTLGELEEKSKVEISAKLKKIKDCNSNDLKVVVNAYDQAGNKVSTAEEELAIDMVNPKITVSYDNNVTENDKYFVENRTMTITYKERNFNPTNAKFKISLDKADEQEYSITDLIDNKLIGVTAESISDSESDKSAEAWSDERTIVYQIQFGNDTIKDMDVSIKPSLRDLAGNDNDPIDVVEGTKAPYEFTIDKTKPQIQVAYDNNNVQNGKYFSADRTMTVTYTEKNFSEEGLSFVVSVDGSESVKTLAELKKMSTEGIEVSNKKEDNANKTVSYDITFNAGNITGDKDYKITPHIEDLAGLENNGISLADKTEAASDFTIDKTLPVVKVSYDNNNVKNTKYFKANRTMTISYVERNYTEAGITFDVSVDGSSVETKTLADLKAMTANDIIVSELVDNQKDATKYTEGRTITYTIEFNGGSEGDKDYYIVPHLKDLANNSNSEVEYASEIAKDTFTIDKKAPTLSLAYSAGTDSVTPGTTEATRVYKNNDIKLVATINERNFALTDGNFSNDVKQMNLDVSGVDSKKESVAITTKFAEEANTVSGWTKGTGATEKTQTFMFDQDANYALAFTYCDLAGNEVKLPEGVSHYFTVDKTAPTGEIKIKENIWTQFIDTITFKIFDLTSVTVDMTSADETAGVDTQKYYKYYPELEARNKFKALSEDALKAVDETKWIEQGTAYVNPNEQTAVYEKVVDKAGNVTYLNSDGIIADNQKADGPEISINVDPSADGIYNKDVPFTINVTDPEKGTVGAGQTYSGLYSVSYEVRKDGTETQSGNYDVSLGKNDGTEENNKRAGRVKNLVRNETVKAEDNNSNNVTIYVRAEDNAGNVSETTKDIMIDITKPIMDVSYDNNEVINDKYFSKDRTMTVTYTERNFDKNKATFDVTLDGKNVGNNITLDDLNKLNGVSSSLVSDTEQDKINKNQTKDLTDGRKVVYTIAFNGGTNLDEDYVIVPHVTDKAANENTTEGLTYAEGTKASQTFTVDKTFPTLDVKYYVNGSEVNPGDVEAGRLYKNETITAVATINERNFTGDTFSQDPKQMNLNVSYTEPNKDQEAIADYAALADTTGNWQSNVDVRTQTFTFDKDANYKLNFTYRDLAGNEVNYGDHYFTVDKTAPSGEIQIHDSVWQSFLQVVSFGFFENVPVGVSMTSGDITAGVASQQYYRYYPDSEARNEFDAMTYSQLEALSDDAWTSGNNFSINPNEQVIPYEKIVDRSGNVTYLNAQSGVITDNVSPNEPQITITMADPAKGIYNSSVPFHISVSEPTVGGTYAGLKSVSYEVRKDGAVTQSGNYDSALSSAASRVQNIERDETVNADLNNSNTVQIYVKAIDNAGNTTEATKDLKIDITKPTITVTYDNNSPLNSKYYKDTRTATVTVTDRNFDPDAVRFGITNTDGTQPSISGWSSSSDIGVSDSATSSCQVAFSADGDYTFTLNVTDLAGNDSDYTQVDEFTMDKTIPTISVSYDNNSAQTPGYYKESRTATVTINEHNFNAADVQAQITASLQGQGVSTPSVSGFSTGGDTHTASISYTADADYTFNIAYSDMAGNAAAAYTQESFTVDKTKPTIDIFDIVDKSANNGTVAPGVNTSDVNYTADGVKITIKGENHNETALDGTRSSIANGQSIKMADFAHDEKTDDIYTLTAQVTDKAGNTEEKSVIFSVNRFGSNYRFLGDTLGFLQKYYNNEEQDIVVEEINVDTVEANSISYGRDGDRVSLKKGSDYTVKASGNEVTWKSYTYTMKKSNFEKEGTYAITIDSKDRATNEVNNKIKNKNIEFVIDKTKPTVVVTGVENNAQYRENSRDITVAVTDNVALDSADIYLDGSDKPDMSYSADTIQKSKGEIAYTMDNNNSWQTLSAVATDAAGNVAETEEYRVLITSNLFVQYYSNKPLLFGSIAGVAAIGALVAVILGKRKKSTSEEA